MTILFLEAVLAAPQFDVQTLSGESASGSIVGLNDAELVIEQMSGKKQLPLKELLTAVAREQVPSPVRTTVLVELTDGSRLAATDFQSLGGTARIAVGGDTALEVPVKSLRWVRFVDTAEKSEKLDAQWNEIVAGKPAGDLLVVRKKGAIDSTDGVVGDVSVETVVFTLDGDKIDVKRPKVEGIVFVQSAGDELPESVCTVVDSHGSRYRASEFKLTGDSLEISTPAGLKTTLPLASVSQFDFSSGKVQFLSDLESESFNYEPYFGLEQPLTTLNEFYRLRRDIGLEKNPLTLDGRAYRKGIALHSRSVVVYRLPGKFRLFKAVAGIDDAARDGGGDVALEVKGDGKSLWKGSVRGNEAAQLLEIDVTGVKRLEIVADYGEGQDVADHLDLCDARVTK